MPKIKVSNSVSIEKNGIDLARRTVTCLLIEVDKPNLNGLIMRAPAIQAALDSYMADWQVVGRMHTEVTNSYPVRCWQDADGNGWMSTRVVDEQDWQAILNGDYSGMSWAGFAEVEQVANGQRECAAWADMLENSFVDIPAVPSAVFNSDGEAAGIEDPADWLINKLAEGKVKPRIRREEQQAKRSMLQRAWTELCSALQANNINLTDGEEIHSEEIEMTPEQIKAMLEELTAPLLQRIDGLTEQVNTLTANSGEVIEAELQAAEIAPALSIEDIKSAVAEVIAPVIARQTEQDAEIAALKDTPAPSKVIQSDGGGAAKPTGLRPRQRHR